MFRFGVVRPSIVCSSLVGLSADDMVCRSLVNLGKVRWDLVSYDKDVSVEFGGVACCGVMHGSVR